MRNVEGPPKEFIGYILIFIAILIGCLLIFTGIKEQLTKEQLPGCIIKRPQVCMDALNNR